MSANSRQGGRTHSSGTLLLTAQLLVLNSFAFAQTPEPQTPTPAPEVEQLKKRPQRLEQTVVEHKGQIDTLETKKKNPVPAVMPASAVMNATYTEPAAAVETASAAPAEPAKPQDNSKGEFQIYGFAMMDAGYQFYSDTTSQRLSHFDL